MKTTTTLLRLLALTTLGLAFVAATAQQPSAKTLAGKPPASAKPSVASPLAANEDSKASDSMAGARGITVHGHWRFVIKNADGSVAKREEFENSLDPSNGAQLLTALLVGTATPADFLVAVLSASGTSPCPNSYCILITSTSSPAYFGCTLGNETCFTGLTTATPGKNSIQLAGQFIAPQNGVIDTVHSYLDYCSDSTVSPKSCAASVGGVLAAGLTVTSSTTNPSFTPINITAGQIVQVSVLLSFS